MTGLTETNAAATESVESDGNVQNVEEPVSQEVRVENDQTASQQEGQQEEAPENSMTTEDDASFVTAERYNREEHFYGAYRSSRPFRRSELTILRQHRQRQCHRMLCLIR